MNEKTREAIELALKKFPPDQRASAIIPALMSIQAENKGYLTTELMDEVAQYLTVPKTAVYEVATFYSLFELKPVGKYKISVCTNISCLLCGCEGLSDYLKQKLNIDFGQTSTDGKFTLKEVECLAACGGAPALQINGKYYENMTAKKIDIVLDALP